MTVSSMTGFARVSGQTDVLGWVWEVRTVNHKSRELRFRLPHGMGETEQKLRKKITECIKRGSCYIHLHIVREEASLSYRLNHKALAQLSEMMDEIRQHVGDVTLNADQLLKMQEFLIVSDGTSGGAFSDIEMNGLLEDFDKCLENTLVSRHREGAALGKILEGYLDEMAQLARLAETDINRSPEAIRDRIALQIARIQEDHASLEEDRLYQEAIIIAMKADIEEELARLKTHIGTARELLQSDKPVGRQLDFLSQELNREANTMCAKSASAKLTDYGLQLKTLIDQFKEQIQNIE